MRKSNQSQEERFEINLNNGFAHGKPWAAPWRVEGDDWVWQRKRRMPIYSYSLKPICYVVRRAGEDSMALARLIGQIPQLYVLLHEILSGADSGQLRARATMILNSVEGRPADPYG